MKFRSNVGDKQEQITLNLGLEKKIELNFDEGFISSDAGMLLFQNVDRRLELSKLASFCIRDNRLPWTVCHDVQKLFKQRVFGIAAGYEDGNDAAAIGKDAMHKLGLGLMPTSKNSGASQPTLSRFENSVDEVSLKALQELFVHIFLKTRKKAPKKLRLYMDTTEDIVHGYQQLSFYNGFYQNYCYTPLFVFADCGFPLAAVLRPGNASPSQMSVPTLERVIENIRLAWPKTKIEIACDAGFAVPELYEYCENERIIYYIAGIGHAGFQYHSEETVLKCKKEFEELGGRAYQLKKYAHPTDKDAIKTAWRQKEERIRFSSKEEGRMQEHFEDFLLIKKYCEFDYTAREWSRARRVIARCHYSLEGPDVRYVITNSRDKNLKRVYEERYCARAKCENWIKELKNYLKSDRTSCQEFKANQFRVLLHTFAYVLLWEVRRKAQMQHHTVQTVQLRLIKVAVTISELASKIKLRLPINYPWKKQFLEALQN